jgi:hypothetical protein
MPKTELSTMTKPSPYRPRDLYAGERNKHGQQQANARRAGKHRIEDAQSCDEDNEWQQESKNDTRGHRWAFSVPQLAVHFFTVVLLSARLTKLLLDHTFLYTSTLKPSFITDRRGFQAEL